MNRFTALLCCLLMAPTIASSQTWEPAARIWDVETLPLIVQVPGGPPLVQLRRLLGSPKPTVFTLFDLTTLSPTSQPYENPLELGYVIGAGDFNGNGFLDYMGGLPPAPFTGALVFDAYTPLEKLVIPTDDYRVGGGFDRQLSYEGDLDGDGINDDFNSWTSNRAEINYGDSMKPLSQQSQVVVELRNIQKNDQLIALGEISGRFFILRMIWEQRNDGRPEYAVYQLIELDSADLRARKDTIGTHIVHSFRPERGDVYWSPIIRADTVWWVGTNSWTDRRFLKITATKIEEVEPAIEWLSNRNNTNLEETWIFGQRRLSGDRPVVVDASRPMLYFSYYPENGVTSPYFEYSRIINTDNLTREILGRARGQQFGPNDGGGFRSATLTPDVDGDGLEDFVVLYLAQPDSGGKDKNVLDLYLTTGRVMTSVMQDLSGDPQSSSSLTARRFDGYWEVMGPVPCSGSNTAPIYDVRGTLVGWAKLDRSQRLRIIDPGSLVGGPKWVVVGDCAIKLL